jgi:hypothetical protein
VVKAGKQNNSKHRRKEYRFQNTKLNITGGHDLLTLDFPTGML